MIRGKQGGGNRFGCASVRLVVIALPPFIFYHVTLVVQLLLCQGGKEVSHPVGFKEEGERRMFRRDDFVVVRSILACRAVHLGSDRLETAEVLAVRHVGGALEHQMLEEVCQAGPAGVLVFRSDMIHDFDRDDGNGRIAVEDDREAIGEPEFFKRQLQWVHGCNIRNRGGNSQR